MGVFQGPPPKTPPPGHRLRWICGYCGTTQDNRSNPCTNCGAPSPNQRKLLATAIQEGYVNVARMLQNEGKK